MEEQILELKTCIAIYQKKYTEVVNLNIGLESKLHYLTEKIRLLEEAVAERDKKLIGSSREQELTKAYEELHSNHVEILNKISSIEKQSSRLMKLDERMQDLEGGMTCMTSAAEELIKVKEKIITPPLPQVEEKIALPKNNSRKKKKIDADPSEKIMDVEVPNNLEIYTIKVGTEDSTITEDGGEF